jgi:hypothetical protein
LGRRGLLVLLGLAWIATIGYVLIRRSEPGLPEAVLRKIEEEHVVCIGVDQLPYWPGDYRQAQCGSVDVEVLGEGDVPESEQKAGIERAVCYRQTVVNPYWEVQRQTRHEILSQSRSNYKVAVVRDGVWTIFPDEDVSDRARWEHYACPQPSES